MLITILTVPVITPLTYTAYLGESAVRFHCTAVNARSVSWHIDGLILHGNELKARGIETMTNHTLLESILTISSTVENNNTRIRCLARHLVELRFVPSEEVVFYVQGQHPKHIAAVQLWLSNVCHSLLFRCTGEVSWPPNYPIWKLPSASHMGCSINLQHNCSGARYIQLYCVQQHQQ